jgi:hypothetical protein
MTVAKLSQKVVLTTVYTKYYAETEFRWKPDPENSPGSRILQGRTVSTVADGKNVYNGGERAYPPAGDGESLFQRRENKLSTLSIQSSTPSLSDFLNFLYFPYFNYFSFLMEYSATMQVSFTSHTF